MDNPIDKPKKIVYLDQNVISNMTKVLDPDFPRREDLLKREPFWLDIYKKLHRLLRLQLIVCPSSHFREAESRLSGNPPFESLQRVYSCLSNECRFENFFMILQRQLLKHFSYYLDGHPDQEPVIPAGQVVIGDLDEWQDVFRVSSFDRSGLEVGALRNVREQLHQHIQKAFGLWQQDKIPMELAAQEEALSLGRGIIETFFSHIFGTLLPYGQSRRMPQSYLELIPPPNSRLVSNMIRILNDRGISDPLESIEKICEYLRSNHLLRVPFIRLMAMLFAAMARKAPSRKESPNRGTSIDVTAIASILPYCDAMFLDREMVGYLNEKPLRDECAHFETQVFSAKSRAAGFLRYLDEIEARAGKEHVALMERSYPHGWLDPFMEVVVQGN